MDDQLELKLVNRFPTIFRDYKGDMRQTCMAWGMSCGDGWFDLLWNACTDIEKELEGTPYVFVAHQVKEKFAGLRFYYGIENVSDRPKIVQLFVDIGRWINSTLCRIGLYKLRWAIRDFRQKFYMTTLEKVGRIVDDAEDKSYITCETCGKPGKVRGKWWVYTLCELCFLEHEMSQLRRTLDYEQKQKKKRDFERNTQSIEVSDIE